MLYRVQYSRVRKRKQGMDGVGQAMVLDAQALDANRLVLVNDAGIQVRQGRELRLIGATAVGNSCVKAGDFAPRLPCRTWILTITGSLFLLGKATLGAGQLLLLACKEFGIANGLTIRGHHYRFETQIQPDPPLRFQN